MVRVDEVVNPAAQAVASTKKLQEDVLWCHHGPRELPSIAMLRIDCKARALHSS